MACYCLGSTLKVGTTGRLNLPLFKVDILIASDDICELSMLSAIFAGLMF